MTNIELVKKAIIDKKLPYWEVYSGKDVVDYQVEDLTPENNWLEFEKFKDSAINGRYKVICAKKADAEQCRVKRSAGGASCVVIDILINNNIKADHVDINSHNAVNNKYVQSLQEKSSKLELELLLFKQEQKFNQQMELIKQQFEKEKAELQNTEKYLMMMLQLLGGKADEKG